MAKQKQVLQWVGWVLLVLGVLGYLLGESLAILAFSNSENLAHIIIGVILLAAVYWGETASLIKWLTVILGLAGLYFGIYGFAVSSDYYGKATFETLDNIVHLIIGIWALWVVWGKKK